MTNTKRTVDAEKPIIAERFADNGEHSHWELIEPNDGAVLWSSDPEETLAGGNKILHTPPIEASGSMTAKDMTIKFFSKYFNCKESEARDCHEQTIDCMVEFTSSQSKRIEELEEDISILKHIANNNQEVVNLMVKENSKLQSEKSSLEAGRATFLDEIRILSERVVKLEGELEANRKQISNMYDKKLVQTLCWQSRMNGDYDVPAFEQWLNKHLK